MAYRLKKKGLTIERLRSGELDPIDRRTKDGRLKASRREFMQELRDKFERWDEADQPQKQRELSDEAFYALEHWPADVKLQRAGQNAANGMPPIPARPCLTIDKLSEPVNQILNVERDADLGIELTPADDFEGLGITLDSKEITLREGLIRRIQRESQAAMARSWAYKRSVIAGRGWYGAMTRFAPGKTFDLEAFVEGYYNQACVTPDPAHERPDGSDMEGVFVGRWVPWSEYKSRWPSAAKNRNLVSNLSDGDFMALGIEAPKWFKVSDKDENLRQVYVVDHFYVVKTNRKLALLTDGSVEWNDELPEDADVVDTREVVERSVKWCKLDGANPEPLEETDWPGPDIPVIKVVGEEVLPYDDERRVMGIVRPSKDPSYGFDAMASKLVEVVAQTPIPSIMMRAGQDEGFEREWNLSTTRTVGRLHYNGKDSEGVDAGPPTTVPRDAPIQPIAMSLAMFDEAVQSGTRKHDPSLGKADPALRSGDALNAVIDQGERGTNNFMDNLKRSIRYEAQILNNLLYPIYGSRPGRLAKIVTGQNKSETIMLGQPYTVSPGSSRPQPVMVPHPEQPGQQMPAPMDHPMLPPNAQQFQLTEHANCNIAITITKSADTRRKQAESFFSDLIRSEPQTAPWFLDLAFKYSDIAGHEEAEERARLMWPEPLQIAEAAKSGKIPPEQAAQQLAQAKQLLQQAQQENQQLQQKLQGKVIEQQGKAQITIMQETAETERADKDREAKLAIAVLQAKVETLANEMAVFIEERRRLGAHTATLQERAHEHAERGKDRIHDILTTNLEHAQSVAENEQLHGHTLEQQANEAALAPEPAPTEPASGA